MNRVSLKQLRSLVATAETGSVTAAAAKLNVTPPAVSLTLKQLAAETKIPLLERRDSGFVATEAGCAVIAAAQRIEAALRDCESTLASLRGVARGTVKVGVVSTAKYFAPRALAAFRRVHPDVEIVLAIGNREETTAALASYELDFAVMGRPPLDLEVERHPLGPHPHIVIGPPDHPLAGRDRITRAELSAETFLKREPGSGTRQLSENLLAGLNATPRIGMEIGSNETIKQAVMAGLGIALISAHTVFSELADARLVPLAVAGTPIVRHWFLVRRSDKELMPAPAAMWAFLTKSGATFLPPYPVARTAREAASGATTSPSAVI
jgi:LysR family transcriptional regulator for metE and metH